MDHLDLNSKLDTGEIFTPKRHMQKNTFTHVETIVHKPTQIHIQTKENNTSVVDSITSS